MHETEEGVEKAFGGDATNNEVLEFKREKEREMRIVKGRERRWRRNQAELSQGHAPTYSRSRDSSIQPKEKKEKNPF
ncbi:hypothetical protein RIF29_13308 [Crotalaria pallida]|uniref:Uncharacterized protein n=1 Tax=Crotalaria pallida TaxID=3830 RepID=A0AAN9IP37_CROPI